MKRDEWWVPVLLLSLLVAAGWWNKRRPDTPKQPAVPVGMRQAPASQTPMDLEYWLLINDIVNRTPTHAQLPPVHFAQSLRNTVARIRSAPVVGIDPSAVRYALQLADFLALLADHVESSNDPWLLMDAFERGRRGDLFGAANEQRQLDQNFRTVATQLQQEGFRLRAFLSAKHRIEFPLPAF